MASEVANGVYFITTDRGKGSVQGRGVEIVRGSKFKVGRRFKGRLRDTGWEA